jgi:glycosyltransferase involved in cell wall biosynthesis
MIVSVIITAYNRENFISEAIESVLNQSYTNFELIILDDCSLDGTFKIASSYIDSRIRLYKNDKNLGQFANRNYAASLALGEIILFVDSDDTILQGAVEHIVALFNKFGRAKFLTLNRDDFYKDEAEINSFEFIRRHIFIHSNLHFGPGGTAIRTSYFKKIGGFSLTYGPAADMMYNLKAALSSNVIVCKLEFLNYRRHEGQEINDSYSYLHYGYMYFNDFLNIQKLPFNEVEIAMLRIKNKRRFIFNCVSFFFKSGNAFKIMKSIRICNFNIKDLRQGLFLR